MKPIVPLMIEHRLIERMIGLIEREAGIAATGERISVPFLDAAVDFIRWYADKTHHGKEEAILFRSLALKELSDEEKRLMEELIEDHDYGRSTTSSIMEAKEEYLGGSKGALETIITRLQALAGFYKNHIRKEEEIFFPASVKYFSAEEEDAMLTAFWEADRRMIHTRYGSIVDQLALAEL